MTTFYEERYNPKKVLSHPDFEVLDDSAVLDKNVCYIVLYAYNENLS